VAARHLRKRHLGLVFNRGDRRVGMAVGGTELRLDALEKSPKKRPAYKKRPVFLCTVSTRINKIRA
jgi:hypothetical protein